MEENKKDYLKCCIKCWGDLMEQEADIKDSGGSELSVWLSFCDNEECERYRLVVI